MIVKNAATTASAISCGRFRKNLRLVDVLVPLWKKIWPVSTAAEVAFRTGDSLRAAEYQLAQKFDLSGAALANLLIDEDGLEHLKTLMAAHVARGGTIPRWWGDFLREQRFSQLTRSLLQIEKDHAQLKRDFIE